MSKIDRLRLSFKAEQFDGHALLRECSQLFHQRVLADLDQLIHRLATRTSRPRLIKRLVIDLGVLDASGWKEQWRTRLLQRLEQALIEELARAEQNRANEDSMTPHDESEAWMHWLHTGVGTASAAPSLSAMNMQAHPAMPAAPVTQLTESAMRTVRTRLQQWLQMNPVLRSAVRRRLAQLCAIPALQDIWAAYEAQHPEQAKLDSLTRAAQGIPLTPYSPDAIAESIRPASDAVSAQQDAIWPDASEHAPDMPYRMNPAIVPNELAGLSAGFGLLWPLLPGVLRALERNKPAADTDDALLWTALESFQSHPAMPTTSAMQVTEKAIHTARTRLQQWLQANPVLRPAVRHRLAQLCAIPALKDIWTAYEAQHPKPAKADSLARAAQDIPFATRLPDAIAKSNRTAPEAVPAQQDAIWPDASEHAPDMPYRMNPAIVPNELAGLSAGFGLLWPLLPGVLRALERNKPAADTDDALLWTALESFQSYPVMPTSSAMQVTEKAIHTARTRLQQWLQANPVLRPAVRHRLAQLCAIPALKDIWAAYEAQHPEPAKADSLARAAQDISSATRLPDAIAGSNRPAPEAVSAQRTVRPDAPVLPDTPDRINRSRDRNAAFIPSEFAVLSAGLVLLWPMLPGLFRTLALLDDANHFIDASAPLIAAGWLDELAWGDDTVAEWRTPVNKLLCGVALDAMLPDWQPDPTVRAQLNGWLAALPSRLPGLHRCSVTDVRQLFLQRPGMLTRQPNKRWTLQVEPHAADVLLHMIPWPLEQVWLPWCNDLLCVEWRR
ncbi:MULTISPECIES: contractile injection system tape measure protein [Burkholderiaceae]|uniref:contractile injection system tape measure protein n=1 Tax=Burkholderiaceae TaxID=119060 RepID=UPI00095C8E9D|nr:contractile injection system tape measure protein [Burkholderia sp. b13]MCG1017242.1 hypothetical protein [Mycetohabitans sp. B4]SIT70789.1 hypothetical protein SAMN04487768_2058 [Burkholderia sp. b13]